MELTQIPPAYSATKSMTTTKQATEASGSTTLSSDFETFLRMLTVQMQNQDPLNPVDSSDYAVQLATFSSVEQQVLTNDLLSSLSSALTGGSMQKLSGWIGMEALARAPVEFAGSPVNLRPEFASGADAAVLVVRDASGATVQRLTLDLSEDSAQWAGVDDSGTLYPAGIYRFDVESYQNDSLVDTTIAPVFSRIEEARISGDVVLLRLSDGTELESSLVTGLRASD
ncbi:flagellar hook capping FlgD N-terminal domain-containing protein [Puniceibacterium sp. IMCC21224]|uniref:flagellar hook capping FlgD N-terminal domain-containing protein n=1 Tax=Puniceibacterium sp. IMCC21224 TaxID=1618204 RepID=UPI00064E01A6|nr:flagellar hook capping FlgD N-terminal domain-containing protein [Puniceibacterium sp. IMCC21224]KMK65891.1 flagellar hook capping protein [Puniceibacterium sp. IMCC21224]